MHRILVTCRLQSDWYAVIREANRWFGTGNWRGQRRVKRTLRAEASRIWLPQPRKIWFEIPDIRFASWLSVKYTLPVEVVDKEEDSEIAE
jgi:hypothetical protein